MLRRFGAAAAVLAFLYGFSAAPFAHRHHAIDSVSDEQHPHGETLVHTHTSPHSHHGADRSEPRPAGREDSDEQIWSVASFVPHQSAFSHTQPPALQVFGELYVELASVRLAAERWWPRAHGPPVQLPSGLRAPPAFLPAIV